MDLSSQLKGTVVSKVVSYNLSLLAQTEWTAKSGLGEIVRHKNVVWGMGSGKGLGKSILTFVIHPNLDNIFAPFLSTR